MKKACFEKPNCYFVSPMKLFTLKSLALAAVSLAALLPSGQAQTTVTTDPVGFTSVVINSSSDGVIPGRTVVCTPLHAAPVYAGTITSVDGTSAFSDSNATWTGNQFVSGSTPYLVKIKSGASVGRFFLVTSNSTSHLTVNPGSYALTSLLTVGDTYEIDPANTLSTLFTSGTASGSFPFQTGASANVADVVCIWNGTGWYGYFNNGTNWKRSGSGLIQDNTIIYPDEALYIIRRSTNPLTLTFTGTIPTTVEQSDIPGSENTFLANRYPQDMVLYSSTSTNSISLQNLPNWQSGASALAADRVSIWNGTGWYVYYFNGTNWKRSGSGLIQDSTVIPANSAIYISRISSSGTSIALPQPLPYSL